MKVCTDACLFGAWCAAELEERPTAAQHLLDIGAGTGLLSLMIRQKAAVQIDAVEIDEVAAQQATKNVAASPWPGAIHIIHGNVLDMGVLKKYDYIISNPPFYEADLQSPDNRRNTAHHSQQLNLQQLLQFIQAHLHQTGRFFLLLPYKRDAEARGLLQQNGLFLYKEVLVRQTNQHAPFRLLLQGGLVKQALQTQDLTIAQADQHYTPVFIALLKAYYLHL